MSMFWHILEEHADLFTTKGYTEESLNSPDKPGWYMQQLERHLSKAIREAHALNEKTEFNLKTVAFFNQDADLILFNFNYQYDPETLDLKITQLDATMDGLEMNISLTNNKELPQATMVHRSFTTGEKLLAARNIATHSVSRKGRRL